MTLIEIFMFFFCPPGRRRWQNLFLGKSQFLFPIWKRNRIISLRRKLKKASKGCLLPAGGCRALGAPRTGEWHGWTLCWSGSDTQPDPEPYTKLCWDPRPPTLPFPPRGRAMSHPGRPLPPRVSWATACLSFPLSAGRKLLGSPALPRTEAWMQPARATGQGTPSPCSTRTENSFSPAQGHALQLLGLSKSWAVPGFSPPWEDMHYAVYSI